MNIAVTQMEYFREDRNQMLDSIDQKLSNFLQILHTSIYPIPNSFTEKHSLQKWIDNANIEAIILSGGGNVGDLSARDHVERMLINHAIQYGIPIIGICRGMQAIIVHFGGTLVAIPGHVKTRHKIFFKDQLLDVNSFHDFCIDYCSNEFDVLARAEDNTIESVYHKKLQILGIMWHPEREDPFQIHDLNLIGNFLRGKKL